MDLIWLALIVGVFVMLVVACSTRSISNETVGSPQMVKVPSYIQEGTKAFIKRQYRTIAVFVALTLIPLALIIPDVRVAIAFEFGTSLSLLVAYARLRVAVETNVRCAHADC
jgi:K(+)-stimulated pyrophosphate-energized sodium pump